MFNLFLMFTRQTAKVQKNCKNQRLLYLNVDFSQHSFIQILKFLNYSSRLNSFMYFCATNKNYKE